MTMTVLWCEPGFTGRTVMLWVETDSSGAIVMMSCFVIFNRKVVGIGLLNKQEVGNVR